MAINATYAAFTKKVVAFSVLMSKIMVPFFGKRTISAENQWCKPLGMMAEKRRNQTVYYR